jgi:hypothetical protein
MAALMAALNDQSYLAQKEAARAQRARGVE